MIRPPPLQNNLAPGGPPNLSGVMGRLNMATMPRPDLPLHIQMLFTSRPPLPYLKPPARKRCRKFDPIVTPVCDYLAKFEIEDPPIPEPYVSKIRQKALDRKKKLIENALKNKEIAKQWNPHDNKDITNDPMKTIFVGNLSYTAREKHLKREFEQFGPVRKVRIVKDIKNDNKPRGYAFIEFEVKRDFISAYKDADGMKIDGRRIMVDCERGRTIKGFRPKRLGGGKGESRRNKEIERSLQRSMERYKSRSRSKEKKEDKKKKKADDDDEDEKHKEKDREKDQQKDREKDREKDRDRSKDRSNSRKKDKKEKNHSDKDKKKEKKDSKRNKSKEHRKEKKDKKEKEKKSKKDKDDSKNDDDHGQQDNRKVKIEDNGDLEHGEVQA